jgi:hypothetical protein
MKRIGQFLDEQKFPDRPKNLSTEFQVYGVYLAECLGDTTHYSLYIKLAKECQRAHLEQALNFVKGFNGAKSKPKLFMWKLAQLKKAMPKQEECLDTLDEATTILNSKNKLVS